MRRLFAKLKNVFRNGSAERELTREVDAHLAMLQDQFERQGMRPADARFEARRAYGGIEQAKELHRDERSIPWIEQSLQDARYAVRTLLKSPGFTAVALLTLALGIGANIAIFTVVNAVLLQPLPFPEPERLVRVFDDLKGTGAKDVGLSVPELFDLRDRSGVFEHISVIFPVSTALRGGDRAERIEMMGTSFEYFEMLRASAALGRTFGSQDTVPGFTEAVVISDGLWRRQFGGDPHVLGRRILVDEDPYTIVGVMPPGFRLLVQRGGFTAEPAQFWSPLAFKPEDRTPVGRYLMVVARLKQGVALAKAQSQMDSISADLAKQFPEVDTGWGTQLVGLHDQFFGSIRPALLVLLGAVGFVLLIACANVANLLLGRAARRRRELAIRFTMGASRARIARQLLTETMILAVAGGSAGALLAFWGTDLLLALSPKGLIDAHALKVDFRVLAFLTALTILTGLLFGLLPALLATRTSPGDSLKEGERNFGVSVRGKRARNSFVIGEIGLALVLLTGSGLLVKSFLRLLNVAPGFDPRNLLTLKVDLPSTRYGKDPDVIAFYADLLLRIKALPGVESASASSSLPFTGIGSGTSFTIEGLPASLGNELSTDVRVIEPDYFRTMRIPLQQGRLFTPQEDTRESHVVIVSEALAQKYFPNQNPLEKKITIDMKDRNVPSEIVGVVGDVKHHGLDSTPRPTIYWPHPELVYNSMTLVVRGKVDPLPLTNSIRAVVQSLDPDLPISEVRTMDQWMSDNVAQARFNTLLLGMFSALALLLAVIGIYGVMSATISERTHEIGVRIALGATPRDIWRHTLAAGAIITLAGLSTGLAASLILTRLLASLLYEVKPGDPATFALVTTVLASVALLACYLPARRAVRVDPMIALRYE
jgi:putative ABC transport system permease protein